jgi:hypothetical protein
MFGLGSFARRGLQRGRGRCKFESSTGHGEGFCADSIAEKADMADAVETVGQDMQQKAPDELEDVQRHGPVADCAVLAVVLDLEGRARAVEGDQPAVGDRDTVGGRGGYQSCGRAAQLASVATGGLGPATTSFGLKAGQSVQGRDGN